MVERLLSELSTEQAYEGYDDIDLCDTFGILDRMNQQDMVVPKLINPILPQLVKAVDQIVLRLQRGGRLIYLGAGTSGRLGILDAVECPPTYGTSPSMVQGIIAGGPNAVFQAVEDAEDQADSATKDLQALQTTEYDVVFGISASGRTPYVLGGMRYAKSCGALTIALSCNHNAVISQEADIPIEVSTGPEVVLGSTRLKAGTAQKLILNMISTTTMIKLGKVYKNLMVDLKVSNHKLRERAKRIVMMAAEVGYEEAAIALDAAAGNVKLAVIMVKLDVELETAEKLLAVANGNLRLALI